MLAALHDATAKVADMSSDAMGSLDLGGLGDLGGLAAACSGRPPVTVYAGPVQDLIDELGRLPGIGPKSAQRIAFHLLKLPRDDALRLARRSAR